MDPVKPLAALIAELEAAIAAARTPQQGLLVRAKIRGLIQRLDTDTPVDEAAIAAMPEYVRRALYAIYLDVNLEETEHFIAGGGKGTIR